MTEHYHDVQPLASYDAHRRPSDAEILRVLVVDHLRDRWLKFRLTGTNYRLRFATSLSEAREALSKPSDGLPWSMVFCNYLDAGSQDPELLIRNLLEFRQNVRAVVANYAIERDGRLFLKELSGKLPVAWYPFDMFHPETRVRKTLEK